MNSALFYQISYTIVIIHDELSFEQRDFCTLPSIYVPKKPAMLLPVPLT